VLYENNKEIKHEIQSLDDLYKYDSLLNEVVVKFEGVKVK
jgi:hypothetical protein